MTAAELFLAPDPTVFRAFRTRHVNVLLEGPANATDAVVARLKPYIREPIRWKRRHAALELQTGDSTTLILEEIATLDAEEQSQLLVWLDGSGSRTQVVSTASDPVFPLVARGLFDVTLYYRLNVLLVSLEPSNPYAPPTYKASPTTSTD